MNIDPENDLLIRKATPDEYSIIVDFQINMAQETENLALDPDTVEKGVKAALADRSKGLYYVAETGGKVIASMMITTEWSDWRNGNVWWIQSVYILPEFRGHRIFSRMYAFLKKKVEEDPGVLGLRLYVDRRNHHARRVYEALCMNGQHYTTYEWLK
ncbi:MAG TPA: GNAT family N-acetyltransferase [Bacteroidetes bacterium]|nr:GNAT family N-acetyltransferase [Bacteroidota bacterium]